MRGLVQLTAAALIASVALPTRAQELPASPPAPAVNEPPAPPDAERDPPVPEREPPAPTPAELPDEAFDDAPVPTAASGIRVPRDRGGERWRVVPRTAMYPLRGAWWLLWSVPRLGAWAYDRYQLKDRFRQIFFNDTESLGLFPVAFVETGFGLNAGLRLVTDDLLGYEEKFRARASYGGRFRQHYSAKLSTGRLLGERIELELAAHYEIFPKSRFVGIGNGDVTDTFTPGDPLIDPRTEPTAVFTRYRHDDTWLELGVLGHLTDELSLRLSGALRRRDFDDLADADEDEQLVEVYDPDALVGFRDGLANAYGELELAYDSRRTTQFYLSPAAPSTGWRLSAFAGRQQGFDDDPSAHFRWGLDALRLVDLYRGDRVLVLRAYVEGVTGSLEEIPFVDLVALGGPLLLRGYHRDRFRDRNATLATVEYDYPIERNLGGYLFVDAGRVWRNLEDFAFEDFRLGFGGGLQAHSINSFLMRVFVASSLDGGLFFNLSFDPVYDTRARDDER